MTRIEHSVVILAPIEQVFSYAADYQKWSEWYEGVSGVKTTTATTFDSLFLKLQWDRIVKNSLNNLRQHFRP